MAFFRFPLLGQIASKTEECKQNRYVSILAKQENKNYSDKATTSHHFASRNLLVKTAMEFYIYVSFNRWAR